MKEIYGGETRGRVNENIMTKIDENINVSFSARVKNYEIRQNKNSVNVIRPYFSLVERLLSLYDMSAETHICILLRRFTKINLICTHIYTKISMYECSYQFNT